MKVRIIVGISCALFAIGCLICMGYGFVSYLFIPMSLISALCIHEIMGVSGCKNKLLTVISMIFAFIVPIWFSFDIGDKIGADNKLIYAAYVLIILTLMVKMHKTTRFENVSIALFSSLAIPLSFLCLTFTVRYCDTRTDIFSRSSAVFMILMAMFSAWLSDTFALFFGSAFGKHKLSPNVSPKKSVEGAVAGIVGTTVFGVIFYFIFSKWFFHYDTIKLWMVLLGVPFTCIMGMVGDLAASVIKRNYGVKDFGTLLPEHGGAMDRVDSYLFTMPTVYLLLRFFA